MNYHTYPKIIALLLTVVLLNCAFIALSHATTKGRYTMHNHDISYTDSGQGTPLILIHAFPTDQRLWQPQQKELNTAFRIITLNLPGFGRAKPVDGHAITMAHYADEVHKLMQHLHIQNAIIGGESMGGYVALAFLKKYPKNVAGLILSDTQSIADTPEAKIKREASASAILQGGSAEFLSGFLAKALSPDATDHNKDFLKNIVDSQTPAAMASALRGMAMREDTSNILAQTKIPILIITGENDMVVPPQQSLSMHDLAKQSQLVTIKGAGHLPSLEKSTEWNRAVLEWFGKKN